MPPDFYQIAQYVGLVIAVLLPITALFGFLEDHKDGSCRFRRLRFLAMAVFILAFSFASFFLELKDAAAMLTEGQEKGEAAAERGRALQFYAESNLATMFPEQLDGKNRACTTAAISNYIEDQWRKNYHAESCATRGFAFCSDDEQALYDADRRERNPHHYPLLDFISSYAATANIWPTASDMYKLVKSFSGLMDPDGLGQPDIGTNRGALGVFESYFSNCARLKTPPWITPGAPLVQTQPMLCLGDCS